MNVTVPVGVAVPEAPVIVAVNSTGIPCVSFAVESESATLLAVSGAVTVSVLAADPDAM
jgi:hypothetical protein